jgi:hypothetical protein
MHPLPTIATHPQRSKRIQRGCQIDAKLTQRVEQQLSSSVYSVVRLEPGVPASQPQGAAEQVKRACPATSGRMLGGLVEESPGLKRVRLWMVDLESQQRAVLDDYCSDCDLSERVGLAAAKLTEKGQLGPMQSATPSYCQSEAAPAAAGPVRSNKLAVVIYGEAKAKGAVWTAVKSAVQATGREVTQTHADAKSFGPSDLRKMLREPSGQVLGVELTNEGASVWVFDGPTERTQPKNVACAGCEREELGRKIALTAQAVLDTCFDAQCAEGSRGTAMRPPAEACAPFTEPMCAGAEAWRAAEGSPSGSGSLDAKTARLIKGLTWGAFAVSTASAIALAVANPYVVQTNTAGNSYKDTLTGPNWTMAGVSAGLLVMNIPITVLVNRAQKAASRNSASTSMIQCPN